MNTLTLPGAPAPRSTGLWVFIAVASMLFALFLAAYMMRMDRAADWTALTLPRQLWLSSALLLGASVLLQAAARGHARALAAAGVCTLAFVASQLWAWQVLADARVSFAGNPAASFFYLLTAMHGLHVAGGLVAWTRVLRRRDPAALALLARYWHFLFVLWLVLYAALAGLSPDVVAFLCGRSSP